MPKRQKIKIACENCRNKKKKCDGNKPVCGPCQIIQEKKVLNKLKNLKSKNGSLNDNLLIIHKNLPQIDCHYRSLDNTISNKDNTQLIENNTLELPFLNEFNNTISPYYSINETGEEENLELLTVLNNENNQELIISETLTKIQPLIDNNLELKTVYNDLIHLKIININNSISQDGHWDRSIERILNWKIFNEKYNSLISNNNKLTLLRSDIDDDSNNVIEFNEPLFMDNLEIYINNYILNVHTSGNLFIDILSLRNSVKEIKDQYENFLLINNLKSYKINEFFFLKNNLTENESIFLPIHLILLICAISLLSNQYNTKNLSNYLKFKNSIIEKNQNLNSIKVYYKLSKFFQKQYKFSNDLLNLNNIQFNILLSMYYNYLLCPFKAFHYIQKASNSIINHLELFPINNNNNNQLIQRVFWQCQKNETELKLYLFNIYSSSGILNYKPIFKIKDLKIPGYITKELNVIKDGWAFYLTEIFIRPIINKIFNFFYSKNGNNWNDLSQNDFVIIIKFYLKETGNLLKIFEKFLKNQNLSTPLRCADERVIRIKESLSIPLIFNLINNINLPLPNFNNELKIDYSFFLHPYLISFLRNLCDEYLKIDDLIEFSTERRHGIYFRLKDLNLNCLIMMIIYKKFGNFFFSKNQLKFYFHKICKILSYWELELVELKVLKEILVDIFDNLPFINE